jgi:glycosyltransferase involved in cell wall biosynthesis
MPVRNGEPFLTRALDGLLAQTFDDFEVVVSDNASTDATPEICAEYARRDSRVRWFRQEDNLGAAGNYNFVFREARAPYFAWATHDDERHPENLRRCVAVMDDASPSVVLVYPRAAFIDADGDVIGFDTDHQETAAGRPHRRLAHTLWQVNRAAAVMGLWRSSALARTRLVDSVIGADYVLLAEAALLGEIKEVPEVLFYRRIHEGNSRVRHPTKQQTLEWYTAKKSKAPVLPIQVLLAREYHRSVSRLPLHPLDRALCHATIPRVVATRRARVVGGRVKKRLREVVNGSRAGGAQSASVAVGR